MSSLFVTGQGAASTVGSSVVQGAGAQIAQGAQTAGTAGTQAAQAAAQQAAQAGTEAILQQSIGTAAQAPPVATAAPSPLGQFIQGAIDPSRSASGARVFDAVGGSGDLRLADVLRFGGQVGLNQIATDLIGNNPAQFAPQQQPGSNPNTQAALARLRERINNMNARAAGGQ